MSAAVNLFFIFLPLIALLAVAGSFSWWLNRHMSLSVGNTGVGGAIVRWSLRAVITLGIVLVTIFGVAIVVTALVAIL